MKELEWSEESLDDMAALDKVMARRIKKAVERFAEAGSGNVKKLQGIDPPEFRLRVGNFRVRFRSNADTSTSQAKGLSTDAVVREALDKILADAPEHLAGPRGEARPIWEVMLDSIKDVSPEELARLPKDGASEHDH